MAATAVEESLALLRGYGGNHRGREKEAVERAESKELWQLFLELWTKSTMMQRCTGSSPTPLSLSLAGQTTEIQSDPGSNLPSSRPRGILLLLPHISDLVSIQIWWPNAASPEPFFVRLSVPLLMKSLILATKM
ncbi:hypothetical protein Ancab_038879 [Ancistrocladus abbreviatus]